MIIRTREIFRILLLLLLIVKCSKADEACIDLSTECCWRSTNTSIAWTRHETIDQNWYRRTFRIGTVRAPPARGYYSSVLSDAHEISALESCEFCSGTGNVKILIRHWISASSKIQLCWRQNKTENPLSQCKDLDINKNGLIETQTIKLHPNLPAKFMVLLRSKSTKTAASGLIDFLTIKTDPCSLRIQNVKEKNSRITVNEDIVDGETGELERRKISPSPAHPDNPNSYEDVLNKKRTYYDKLLEKQLLRRQMAAQHLAVTKEANMKKSAALIKPQTIKKTNLGTKTKAKNNINERSQLQKKSSTTGWSIKKEHVKEEEPLKELEAIVLPQNSGIQDSSNKGLSEGEVGKVNIEVSKTTTGFVIGEPSIPDPLTDMFGKDFAEFLEPSFDTSKYDEDEIKKEKEKAAKTTTTTMKTTKHTTTKAPSTTTTSTTTTSITTTKGTTTSTKRSPTLSTVSVHSTSSRLNIRPLSIARSVSASEISQNKPTVPVLTTEPSFSGPVHSHKDIIQPDLADKVSLASLLDAAVLDKIPVTTSTLLSTLSSSTSTFTQPRFPQTTPLAPIAPPTWSVTTTTERITTKPSTSPEVILNSSIVNATTPSGTIDLTEKLGDMQIFDGEGNCQYSGGCLFENGLCNFSNSQFISTNGMFKRVSVGDSKFVETRVNPGQISAFETEIFTRNQPFFVVFDYLEWTEGERFMACCYKSKNAKGELKCPFESDRGQNEVLWKNAQIQCDGATEKLIFICENLGKSMGICAVDNVRLHPEWDPEFTEPCQRDLLSLL